jgi:8-oxo-dGTP pyrophosphatase MutT (NUDIX family)
VPYTWKQDGEKFCTYKQDERGGPPVGDPLHCFGTKAEAVQQLKALYASGTVTAAAATQPAAAGVALHSLDTGRVLFIQRALMDAGNGPEPAGGLWEIPGGKLDPGETPWDAAAREFAEETGSPLPADSELQGTWLSPDGVYQGFCVTCPGEDGCPMDPADPASGSVDNPDNPQGQNYTESKAWMDPAHLDRGPRLLRPEMRKGTPWAMLKDPTGTGAAAAPAATTAAAATLDPGREERYLSLLAAGTQEKRPGSVKLSTGWAYPITDAASLHDATLAFGRSLPQDRAKLKAHIVSTAKQLGLYDKLDDKWKGNSMAASADELMESLVASLAQPVSALLPEEPLPGPTPWTIADDGTADGHLALWASCHIGYPGCVKPPVEDAFDFYNLGDAVTADGRHVGVGKVTVGCGHAGPDLSWRTAAAHYDESGTAVAVARATADKWGIRLPSVLVASATGPQIDEARRSPLSGDWRRINGRLRLVASLGVNVPGYPVPRAMVAAGEVQAMFLGFDPEDAAKVVAEADSLAASIGLDFGSRAEALRLEVVR